MADAKELIDALRDDFFRRCENDRKLKRIAEKLENGTYVDAHDYSVRIGELLSQSFSEVLTEDIYPELTEEMAREIIPSLLGSGHKRTSEACVQVQRNLNQQAGLGLKPVGPEFDVSRAYDLAEKYVSYDKWEDARWSLGEPVENFMQSVPDDSIRRNADFQWRSGMSPKIIRRAEPGACKWCRALAGTYNYEDVRATGSDVYRRHEFCRCTVEYDPGDGRRQDVHTKQWLDTDEIERRIALSEILLIENNAVYHNGKAIILRAFYPNPNYRVRVLETHRIFAEHGWQSTEHFCRHLTGRIDNNKIPDIQSVLDVLNHPSNYIDLETHRYVRWYNGIAVLIDDVNGELVTVVKRNTKKEAWVEIL